MSWSLLFALFFAAPHPRALPPQSPDPPLLWSRGAAGCSEWLWEGITYRSLASGGLRVTVMLDDFGPAWGAAVRLDNLTAAPIHADLREAWIAMLAPREMVLHYRSALLVSRAVDRHPDWKLDAFLALEPLASLNPDGRPAAAAASDDAAVIAAAERQTAVSSARILARALEPGMIPANGHLSGLLFFDPEKRIDSAILNLPLNGQVYAIPFTYH